MLIQGINKIQLETNIDRSRVLGIRKYLTETCGLFILGNPTSIASPSTLETSVAGLRVGSVDSFVSSKRPF